MSNQPAAKRVIVVAALLVAAFLAGFLLAHVKGMRLADELSEARQENRLAELRDLAGLIYLQASQMDYGLAAGTSARFFERTREAANQTPDPSGKKALEDLLSVRDEITLELAKGEPGVLNNLQTLFVRTRQATAVSSPARANLSEPRQ
jgi:hypothetical protein